MKKSLGGGRRRRPRFGCHTGALRPAVEVGLDVGAVLFKLGPLRESKTMGSLAAEAQCRSVTPCRPCRPSESRQYMSKPRFGVSSLHVNGILIICVLLASAATTNESADTMGDQLIETSLSTLERADGSATYSHNGYTVVAAVNGPIEVQRRDELPEEAVLDVVVRPAAGIGGNHDSLDSLDLTELYHRCSGTLSRIYHTTYIAPRSSGHITSANINSSNPSGGCLAGGELVVWLYAPVRFCTYSTLTKPCTAYRVAQGITVLPALLQSSMLALLSSSIPLRMTLTSISIAADSKGKLLEDPTSEATHSAASFHVLGFSSKGELLVDESEGKFSTDVWETAFEMAKSRCQGAIMSSSASAGDVDMEANEHMTLEGNLRLLVQHKISNQHRWENDLG